MIHHPIDHNELKLISTPQSHRQVRYLQKSIIPPFQFHPDPNAQTKCQNAGYAQIQPPTPKIMQVESIPKVSLVQRTQSQLGKRTNGKSSSITHVAFIIEEIIRAVQCRFSIPMISNIVRLDAHLDTYLLLNCQEISLQTPQTT